MSRLLINAVNIVSNAPINDFKYLVNIDNTGDPFSPNPQDWPSLKPGASHSPVVINGDFTSNDIQIPDGKYIISLRAPGYKLGGAHVNLSDDTEVTIKLYPHPLPLSKIRVHVFHDNNPVNGEDDIPLESGLAGFHIVITDAIGEVTVDYFGNPLGTQYEKDNQGNFIYDLEGNPIPVSGTGGKVFSDSNGDALIEYIPPGKYGVQAIPEDGLGWIQTTTIEGTHVIDAWIEEGNDGYSPREGFLAPLVWFGFIKAMDWGEAKPPGSGLITGRIRTVIEFTPPTRPLTLGDPVDRPWITLTDIGENDRQVYAVRGNRDGTFTIQNVPDGLYQMAIWDEPLDHIISFRTIEVVNGGTVNMGDVGIPRWFGWIKGKVFRDVNGDGIQNEDEEGIPNVEVGTRFKDGSIQYGTVTDMNGNYSLNEVFELERFAVAELGYTRFGYTKASATPDFGISPPRPTTTYDRVLTLAELTWAAKTNRIDWGMKEYPLTLTDNTVITNGGISGIVYYATMRNEINPQNALPEDYEPGVPNVEVKLYRVNSDSTLALINTTQTDAWEQPENCLLPDGNIDPGCIEVPNASNQIKEGVFDGGYAFNEIWILDNDGNPIPDPLNPGEFLKEPIPEGTYVVEILVPEGYRILDENSVNTSEGDVFTLENTNQNQFQSNALQMSQSASARMGFPNYYNDIKTMKILDLCKGMNAACDFYIYTDVPIPGRILGFLLDDVNIETDPSYIYYGEKRGISYTPVGIRDFKGKLIKTVYSDKNGIFEVLLPSTYTANVPIPSGVVPGMYQVIGNDPGDIDNPNADFNPNYQTLKLVFDVWPGKTTLADVALFPITAFVETPGGNFSRPPQCGQETGVPKIKSVDRVYVNLPTQNRNIIINGLDFGTQPGNVRLENRILQIILWTDTQIIARIPSNNIPGGPYQLFVSRPGNIVSRTGLTIHILNTGYKPTVTTVLPGQTIQDAIDIAPNESLVVVPPGVYRESLIIHKGIKLQGHGADVTTIDGEFFLSYKDAWVDKLNSITFDGPQEISQGQVITVVAQSGDFKRRFNPQIDGFMITGSRGEEGGGIVVNAYCRYLEISNNVIQSNGGGFGGGITIGRAYAGDNHNEDMLIHHNRVLNNGGISLAGGIGIFNGADRYDIGYNEICGNYSAEYGGGISHFGYSNGGSIHDNRIRFNASFDEGAGILIGGEQPIPPEVLTQGSGRVDVFNNYIVANVANDDGGGIRLLKAGTHRIRIFNNIIANNVSTDLGGGIALDDSSNVWIYNNTIAKNITTATAEDSDGNQHGAGIVSEGNSAVFQASLPPGSKDFSDPILFNNIFWDNRAHYFDIASGALSNDYEVIDLEVFGAQSGGEMTLYNCYLSKPYGSGTGNIIYDGTNPPGFINEYDTKLRAVAFNMEPEFVTVKIVSVEPEFNGNYHILPASPARDNGAALINIDGIWYSAPSIDIDNELRLLIVVDMGADEIFTTNLNLNWRETVNQEILFKTDAAGIVSIKVSFKKVDDPTLSKDGN